MCPESVETPRFRAYKNRAQRRNGIPRYPGCTVVIIPAKVSPIKTFHYSRDMYSAHFKYDTGIYNRDQHEGALNLRELWLPFCSTSHILRFVFLPQTLSTNGRCERISYVLRLTTVDRDSSVGIATGYRLDGPGIESRWERDFPHLSRPALGPIQPSVQ